MKDVALAAYHRLPAPVQSMAASTWGLWLLGWRSGVTRRRSRIEALEREQWGSNDWKRFREARLQHILERAATGVPYYRSYWERRAASSGPPPWTRLENWPILTKAEVKASPRSFVADDRRTRWMYAEHTSGSSGTPLTLWWSRETTQRWHGLLDARALGWNGLRPGDRWAMLGGQLIVPVERRDPPFWVWNAPFRQLYLSSYHITPEVTEAYIDAMRAKRVVYVLGYASSIYALARNVHRLRLKPPRLRCVISNAEPLYDHQREMIAESFKCPVVDTYGMAEIVAAGSECSGGRMHLWPEVGLVEVVDEQQDLAVPEGGVGRFVCTGLLNADMPLIRYEVGDRGSIRPSGECECGRRLPVITSLEGRLDDVLVLRDGREVGRLDPVFKTDLPIEEAQIVQDSVDHIRVRVVPAAGFGSAVADKIISRLADRVGDVHIEVEQVTAIERTGAGKFRAVVSHVGDGRGH